MYRRITDEVISSLNQNIVPWNVPWKSSLPQNITGRTYTGINLLFLQALPYKDQRFLTHKQVNTRGGYVKKGEKGHPVYFWKIMEEEGKDPYPVLKFFTVFNIEQCSGMHDLAEVPQPFIPFIFANNLLSKYTMKYITVAGSKGCLNGNTITIGPKEEFYNSNSYYSRIFYLLVEHARKSIGHPREKNTEVFEEVVKELGACYLRYETGCEGEFTLTNSLYTIKNLVKVIDKDVKFIMEASSVATKCVNHILGRTYDQKI